MNHNLFKSPGTNVSRADVLENVDEASVLHHFLGFLQFGAPAALTQAAMVCLDIEWYQHEPNLTIELGISELMAKGQAPNTLAENILTSIRVAHARITSYAHLKNSFTGVGDPNIFEFGTTKFVTQEEAKEILINTFARPSCSGDGALQPIILIGHAVESMFGHLERVFEINLHQYGTVVKVIDTQAMAVVAGIKGPAGRIISLKHLLEHFGMKPKNLHSAGTDAAYTMVVAILLALKDTLYPVGNKNTLPQSVQGRNINAIIRKMMALGKSYPPPPWGRTRFCTRCDRENHFCTDCRATLSCDICQKSGVVRLYNSHKTHATSKCMFNYVPLPVKDPAGRKSSAHLIPVRQPSPSDDDHMGE